jgi:hypothetical protein
MGYMDTIRAGGLGVDPQVPVEQALLGKLSKDVVRQTHVIHQLELNRDTWRNLAKDATETANQAVAREDKLRTERDACQFQFWVVFAALIFFAGAVAWRLLL